MAEALSLSCTCFDGSRRLASGPLGEVVLVAKAALDGGADGPVLTFDDATGRVLDLDVRGTDQEVLARLEATQAPGPPPEAPRGRGRPRLGVVAREVTLLPRHWAWLNAQPGGASVALRSLVEEARRTHRDRDGLRQAQEAAFRFMSATAGDAEGFEEALRALFARDGQAFDRHTRSWPADLRDHARRMAEPALAGRDPGTAAAGAAQATPGGAE